MDSYKKSAITFSVLVGVILTLMPRVLAESRFGEWRSPSEPAYKSNAQNRFRALEDEEGEEVTLRPTQSVENSTQNFDNDYRDRLPASEPGRFLASAEKRDSQPLGAKESLTEFVHVDTKGIQEFAIVSKENGFYPRAIVVTRDIPVRLFVTRSSHSAGCFMMNAFNVKRQVKTGAIEEVEFTPKKSGVYRFFCPATQSDGALIVRDAGALKSES